MSSSLSDILLELRAKIEILSESRTTLYREIERLKNENDDLKADLDRTRKELERKSLDSHFLELSHVLADSPDNLVLARRRIANLIRTVESCIAMLKDGSV